MEGAEGTSRFYECRVTRRPSLGAVLISTEMDRRSERERDRERERQRERERASPTWSSLVGLVVYRAREAGEAKDVEEISYLN